MITVDNQPQDKPAAATPQEDKAQRSFGNKVFDLVLWPLVMGAGVWVLSYAIAKEGTMGTSKLRTATDKFTNWLEKKIEPINPEGGLVRKVWKSDSKEWAKSWAMWSLVSIPGTALTPVMQYIERHRKPISEHIDKAFHKSPADPENIKPEPKQTFYSMIAGRGMVVLGAASTMLAFGPKGMDWTAKKVGAATTALYEMIRPNAHPDKVAAFRKNSNIAVFDMILTLGATAVMYGWSRRVARKHEALHPHEAADGVISEKKQSLVNSAATAMGDTLPDATEPHKKTLHTARAGERPADFRALASKEPASSGIALS